MPVAEIVVTPLGTGSPSLSRYIAKVHEILKEANVKYQLTPMSTIVEGDLDTILDLAKRMHQALFKEGVMRVVTSIRIDERRDKELTMEGKVKSVMEKLSRDG